MRCESFIREAVLEVEKRLPPVKGVFENLSGLHPSKVLSQVARLRYQDLPFPHLRESLLMEEQYRKVLHVTWADEPCFNGKIPSDCVEFWVGVREKEVMGTRPFKSSWLSMP